MQQTSLDPAQVAAKKLRNLQQRAVRATLHPLLHASASALAVHGEVPAAFLIELATALLKYRPRGPRAQRRVLRRIVLEPLLSDVIFLRLVLASYLTPRGPTSPALH